jgi:branched-chain amino acid transport system substrate-binding protein
MAIVATACSSGTNRAEGSATADQLVLGEAGPQFGPLSWMGPPQDVGARLAVNDINKAGGVLGKSVLYTVAKDATAPESDASGKELLDKNVDDVIGTPASDVSSFDRLLAENGVVHCLPNLTGPLYSSQPTASTQFSTSPPESAVAPAIVEQLLKAHPTRVTIAAPQDGASARTASALSDLLKPHGVSGQTVSYNPDANSFTAIAQQVVASKPQFVVMLSGSEGAALTGALLKLGMSPSNLIGGPGMFSPLLPTEVNAGKPSSIDGMSVYGPGGDAVFDGTVGRTTAENIADAAQAYDCVVITALAVEQAKSADPAVFAPNITEVTTGSHKCTTFAICAALIHRGQSVAYTGHAGPLELNSQNQPTSAREVRGYFLKGYLNQLGYGDYPTQGST